MVNRYAIASRHPRIAAAVVAAVGPVASLVILRDSVAQLIGHFHLEYATAFLIVSLITEGSWWVLLWFPYIAPVQITVEVLVAIFGFTTAVFW